MLIKQQKGLDVSSFQKNVILCKRSLNVNTSVAISIWRIPLCLLFISVFLQRSIFFESFLWNGMGCPNAASWRDRNTEYKIVHRYDATMLWNTMLRCYNVIKYNVTILIRQNEISWRHTDAVFIFQLSHSCLFVIFFLKILCWSECVHLYLSESVFVRPVFMCVFSGRDKTPIWFMYITNAVQLLMVGLISLSSQSSIGLHLNPIGQAVVFMTWLLEAFFVYFWNGQLCLSRHKWGQIL